MGPLWGTLNELSIMYGTYLKPSVLGCPKGQQIFPAHDSHLQWSIVPKGNTKIKRMHILVMCPFLFLFLFSFFLFFFLCFIVLALESFWKAWKSFWIIHLTCSFCKFIISYNGSVLVVLSPSVGPNSGLLWCCVLLALWENSIK